MPAPWLAWTKSLSCKSDKEQIHQPKRLISQSTERAHQLRCSWKFSTLKDIVAHKSTVESPLSRDSLSSQDQVIIPDHAFQLANSNDEDEFRFAAHVDHSLNISDLKPGTPRPPTPSFASMKLPSPLIRKLAGCNRYSVKSDTMESTIFCKDSPCIAGSQSSFQKAGRHDKPEPSIPHIVRRAVTELSAGDSSKNVVEIIFRTSWLSKELPLYYIEKILKVHTTQRTLTRFEEYRDTVKSKAINMIKKHPRCIADGNELLRFYGCKIDCSLGSNGSTSLCTISSCMVCQIIRAGFCANKTSGVHEGIYTAQTSGKAHKTITSRELITRHAMLVCRVIAGRMHKGSAGSMEADDQLYLGPPEGYDSIAGESGRHSNAENLYVFNPRAVLPCFVVIYNTC